MAISLPAPIHEDEESSFGLSAPTSSTTVALALGDALALATAQRLHKSPDRGPAEVFKSFHPGGAIGAAAAAAATAATTPMSMLSTSPLTLTSTPSGDGSQTQQKQDVISNRFVPLNKIPTVSTTPGHEIRLLDILLGAVQNPDAKSWVSISHSTSSTTSSNSLITPRHLRSLTTTHNVDMTLSSISASGISVSVPQEQFLCVPASSTLNEVRRLVSETDQVSVIVGVDETNPDIILGVLEAEELWSD